ncbi:MAG: hypothetical protein PVG30_05525 [Gammaproteobacteria bacterium]|jgi:hypothetical protein
MKTTTKNQQTSKQISQRLFKLGLRKLGDNDIESAKKYFQESLLQGHELATRYFRNLHFSENKLLARTIILCAEERI